MMKKALKLLMLSTAFFCMQKNLFAQDTSSIIMKDIKAMTGCWTGTITYLDYSSGKAFSMPAELKVNIAANSRQVFLYNSYPEEPKANGQDSLSVSENGTKINEDTVVSVRRFSKGSIVIIADRMGEDGNDHKPALLRHIYTITKTTLSLRKDVQFVGSKTWIKRNEFSYTRQPCKR